MGKRVAYHLVLCHWINNNVSDYLEKSKNGSTVWYATPQFLLRNTVRCTVFLFCKLFFVMVWVRYVGTLFELKIPDFSHITPAFCMQRQKTAEADTKCVN